MTQEELKVKLKSDKYGFPFFRMLLEKNVFFDSPERCNIEKRKSDTFVFENNIKTVFDIQDDCFDECYDAVINGEGNEDRKIKSIRSSSLLGLLTFYKVHSAHKLILRKIINNKVFEFLFDQVVFEKTNRVFHPSIGLSSIDVALYGTVNGKPCVLYLESKFTEYLERKDLLKTKRKNKITFPISCKYEDYYRNLFINYPGLEWKTDKNGLELLSNNGTPHYCEGIKQMISHYIGAKNSDDLFKGLKVYLGTILFDFSGYDCNVDKDGELIKDYKKLYSELAKRLNIKGGNNITVIEEAFTYQDLFSQTYGYNLDKRVKEYYQL